MNIDELAANLVYLPLASTLGKCRAKVSTVLQHGSKMPPIDETRAHVQLVLELYWALLQNSLARHAKRINMR